MTVTMKGELFRAMQSAMRLEEARDSLRTLFGDSYDERVGKVARDIAALAAKQKRSALEIAIEAAQKAKGDGNDHIALLFLAAGADASEIAP